MAVRRLRVALHHRYQRHPDSVNGVCTYCGDTADTIDHVPPLAMVYELADAGAYPGRLWLVPACHECNSTLSGRHLPTLAGRRKHLAHRYRRRYASLLRMPRWSNDELSEMKGVLREDIARHWHLARFQRARMERLLGRAYGEHTSEGKRAYASPGAP